MGLTVSIVEAADQILPGFSEAMQQRAERILKENGITVHRASPILEVTDSVIRTKRGDLPWLQESDLLLWTCGVRPVAIMRPFRVNSSLQVEGTSNVWAMGDCVAGPVCGPLCGPPTAQNARQQGAYLAEQLNGSHCKSYSYSEIGRFLDLTYGYLIEIYGICFYIPADFFMQVAF
jgi:NADH dehydrogenase